MANLGCGVNAIIDKIKDIQRIITKYSAVAGTLQFNYPLVTAQLATKTVYLTQIWDKISAGLDAAKATSLYKAINEAYKTAKTGYDAVIAVQKNLDAVVKDFKDIVSDIEGIVQDVKDLTLGIDVSFIEFELLKIGVNPGEILNRLKNGETLDSVLGELKDQLSDKAKAAIDQLQSPLSFSFDTACQKLPNVIIIYEKNTSTGETVQIVKELPAPTAPVIPQSPVIQQSTTRTTQVQAPSTTVLLEDLKLYKTTKKHKTYNFDYFCNKTTFPHNFQKEFGLISTDLARIRKDFNAENIELNMNMLGALVAAPLMEKYPQTVITSGWRPKLRIDPKQTNNPQAISTHSYGGAFDVQFPFLKSNWNGGVHPIEWLKKHMAAINVTVSGKRVGRFLILAEPSKSKDPARAVYHIQAIFVYQGLNVYDERNPVRVGSVPKLE